ncbi:MAG: hypothetical protein VYB48_06690 [Pseudomonadota bacterium]|nr:hypothetical protein [Pseudomonadota bacterium]
MPVQRLIIISDEPEEDLTEQLVDAAQQSDLDAVVVQPQHFDHVSPPVLNHGDLLYRVAITHEACVIEQQLIHPGVATCYRNPLGAFTIWDNQTLFLARYGVPVPRTFHAMTTTVRSCPGVLRRWAAFRLSLKFPVNLWALA